MNENSNGVETRYQLVGRLAAAARDRRRPSSRNLRIADEVKVNGRTQNEVAAEYGLSQRRISQICQQVDGYYCQTEPWERGEPHGTQYEASENELARRRLTEIYRRAMRAHARSEQPLASRRTRSCGGEEAWKESSEREQRTDTGSLRVALRAMEQATKLAQRSEPREGYKPEHRERYLIWVIDLLVRLRREAEQRGEVTRGPEDSEERVLRMVRELMCEQGAAATSPSSAGQGNVAGQGNAAEQGNAGGSDAATEGSGGGEAAAWTAELAMFEADQHHPDGSSSTSTECGGEEAAEEVAYVPPPADDGVASDAAAGSYDDVAAGPVDAAAEIEAVAEMQSRSRGRKRAIRRVNESAASVLTALERAFGMGMSWEAADRELYEFLLCTSGSPMWSYSHQQRAALMAWRRASRPGRATRVIDGN
jgi:hypothetical protein